MAPIAWEVRLSLEKGSSVMAPLKAGSVHLRLSWAEGKGRVEGGEKAAAFQLLPRQWETLGIWNPKPEFKRQTFHLLTA